MNRLNNAVNKFDVTALYARLNPLHHQQICAGKQHI